MDIVSVDADFVFETSWEVCNKIGGIYTVLSTKAKTMQRIYGDNVVFVGPDVWSASTPSPYFIESSSIMPNWETSSELPYGISVRVGRWDIPGKPIAVLVKFDGVYAHLNELYGEMWERYGVDSLHAYGDYGEGCAFAVASAIVIDSLYRQLGLGGKNVVAHFDEWTTGMGLLYLKAHTPAIATVFTTHATSIGRSICGNGKQLYAYLDGYNGDQMARELNMEAKHSLEKTAAHQADCFTTVSEITAIECQQLLNLRPQVVTPNGFEKNFVPTKAVLAGRRQEARRQLLDVAKALTGRDFGDDAFLVATSGRCEYRNKGIDMYLDSIMKLSRRTSRQVVAFVLVPAWVNEARKDLIEAVASNGVVAGDRHITHTLHNYNSDPIINRINSLWPEWSNDGRTQVIYVPCYLDGADGMFNKSYYELLAGFDATVFPSYYEPWGYTPLESIAFGVPTITTSLSGFGRWILATTNNNIFSCGIKVIDRNDSNYDRCVEAIAEKLADLCQAPSEEVERASSKAMAKASKAAWKYFFEYYVLAYDLAIKNAKRRAENK